MNLRIFEADLHIHTCLSPCGELEMTPSKVVQTCKEKGIDIIAICDHNSAENVEWVQKAAEKYDIYVLPGMEITTSEEVHILAFFDTCDQVMTLQNYVYSNLLPGENNDDLFGMQVVANEKDEVEKIVHKLLIGGTTISLNQAIEKIHSLKGLAVPAHIDRENFSILAQLGFIPDEFNADALELSFRGEINEILQITGVRGFPIIRSSDAHQLSDIGRITTSMCIETVSMDELKKAFMRESGRFIESNDNQRKD